MSEDMDFICCDGKGGRKEGKREGRKKKRKGRKGRSDRERGKEWKKKDSKKGRTMNLTAIVSSKNSKTRSTDQKRREGNNYTTKDRQCMLHLDGSSHGGMCTCVVTQLINILWDFRNDRVPSYWDFVKCFATWVNGTVSDFPTWIKVIVGSLSSQCRTIQWLKQITRVVTIMQFWYSYSKKETNLVFFYKRKHIGSSLKDQNYSIKVCGNI